MFKELIEVIVKRKNIIKKSGVRLGVRVDVYKELIEVIVQMKKVGGGGQGPISGWELVGG